MGSSLGASLPPVRYRSTTPTFNIVLLQRDAGLGQGQAYRTTVRLYMESIVISLLLQLARAACQAQTLYCTHAYATSFY